MDQTGTLAPLRISYWNAGGLREETMADVVGLCAQHDIICVGETWLTSHSDLEQIRLPGFVPVVHAVRPFDARPGRPHGGISIYMRPEASLRVGHPTVTERMDAGVVWVTFPAINLCLGACYLGPSQSSWVVDHGCPLQTVFNDLSNWQVSHSTTLIIGDFNARIGDLCSDVPCSTDPEFDLPTPIYQNMSCYENIPHARTGVEDIHGCAPDPRGRDMMDWLRASHMVVLNGRAPGCGNGGYTFTAPAGRGHSTVDYACISASAYSSVHDFRLHHFGGDGHAALSLTLDTPSLAIPTSQTTPACHVSRPPIHDPAYLPMLHDHILKLSPSITSFYGRKLHEWIPYVP